MARSSYSRPEISRAERINRELPGCIGRYGFELVRLLSGFVGEWEPALAVLGSWKETTNGADGEHRIDLPANRWGEGAATLTVTLSGGIVTAAQFSEAAR